MQVPKQVNVPGIVYSLLLAVAAWGIDYFTKGEGSGIPWAPIAVAAIPILMKTFTVQTEPVPPEVAAPKVEPATTEPTPGTRGVGMGRVSYSPVVLETTKQPGAPARNKMEKWLWG